MANCSTCDGKLGFLTKTKIKNGTICMHCFVTASKVLEKYEWPNFNACEMFTVQECKDILADKENVPEIIENIKCQIGELAEITSLNRHCLICGNEMGSSFDGHVTYDGRRMCNKCSSAANTLCEGNSHVKPNTHKIITSHNSEFFIQGMKNFRWISENLSINYDKKTLYYMPNGTYRFDQMVKVENDQETYEVQVGKKGHPILRAVVGNAMFGTAGAVVGAVTANDTRHYQTQKGKRILNIYVKEDDGNIVKMNIKCESDEEFISIEDAIMKIFSIKEEEDNSAGLEEMIKKVVDVSKNTNSTTVSAADEIKKYKDLLDMGAITQDEFDVKKKQLLGL